MPEPTLYLFDGYNLLHAGGFEDVRSLVDMLASFVGLQGARGVVVFDGAGADESRGPLEIRYAPNADSLLERLSAEHRSRERICLVSSDAAVRATSGQEVAMLSSQTFLRDLVPAAHAERVRTDVAGRLDAETLARLERLRRGDD